MVINVDADEYIEYLKEDADWTGDVVVTKAQLHALADKFYVKGFVDSGMR